MHRLSLACVLAIFTLTSPTYLLAQDVASVVRVEDRIAQCVHQQRGWSECLKDMRGPSADVEAQKPKPVLKEEKKSPYPCPFGERRLTVDQVKICVLLG